MSMKKSALTQGSIFKTLFLFSFPMIITNTMNVLFHAADVAVLARFVEGPAVAAVGACGSLIMLMITLFTGLATGANVLIAKRIGAGDESGAKRAIGTSLTIGFLSGIILMTVALIFARRFLIWMNCQPEVLDMATLYMKIYFMGAPIMMLKAFSLAVLRSTGDSVRPMIYALISGATNVVANIFFVLVFNLTVEGVALATVLSGGLTLVLALIRLFRNEKLARLSIRDFGIGKIEFREILGVGVPTCLCSLSFYIAGVILSAAVNSLSTDAMTANSISGQFDGIIYTVGTAIASATAVIVAQNYGAKQPDRIRATIRVSVLYVTAVSLVLGVSFVLFADPLLGILSDSPTVIEIAKDRMTLLCLTYFITSIMEVFAFSLRALKRQRCTTLVGAICGLGIRTLWRFFVWPINPTLSMLFACYAVSATIAIVIYLFVYRATIKRFVTAHTVA